MNEVDKPLLERDIEAWVNQEFEIGRTFSDFWDVDTSSRLASFLNAIGWRKIG